MAFGSAACRIRRPTASGGKPARHSGPAGPSTGPGPPPGRAPGPRASRKRARSSESSAWVSPFAPSGSPVASTASPRPAGIHPLVIPPGRSADRGRSATILSSRKTRTGALTVLIGNSGMRTQAGVAGGKWLVASEGGEDNRSRPIDPGPAGRDPDDLRSRHDEDVRILPHCWQPGGCHRLDGGRRPKRRRNGRAPGSLLSGPYPIDGRPRRRGPRAAGTRPRDWDVRCAHVLSHFQEVAGPLPGGERRVPLDVQVVSTEKQPGFVRKKITFAVEPGDRLPAWLLIPDGPRAGDAESAAPRRALPAPDRRDRQGRARGPGRQSRPGLCHGARPPRLCRDRPGLSRLRRVQDRHVQDGICQRHHEGDLEQPPGRRRALRPEGG